MKRLIGLLAAFTLLVGMATPCSADQDGYFTMLLMGTDMSAQAAAAAGGRFGHSDTMMLISINKTSGDVRMLGVQRDYESDILDDGPNLLSAVSYYAGPEVAMMAVNQLFKVNVSCYVAIDPDGMQKVVDALGGVDVEILSSDLYITLDGGAKAFTAAGTQHCDGAQIRALVSTNVTADGSSQDPSVRSERQRRAMSALMGKALSGDKNQLISFATAAILSVKTNINLSDMLALADPLLSGKVHQPQYAHSPLTPSSVQPINGHDLTVAEDMGLEVASAQAFLYPDVYAAPTPNPTFVPAAPENSLTETPAAAS